MELQRDLKLSANTAQPPLPPCVAYLLRRRHRSFRIIVVIFLSPGGVVELSFLMTVISVNVQLNCFWFLRNNDSGSVSWNNYFRYPQEENVAFILALWEGGLSHSLSFSGISLLRKSSHSLV